MLTYRRKTVKDTRRWGAGTGSKKSTSGCSACEENRESFKRRFMPLEGLFFFTTSWPLKLDHRKAQAAVQLVKKIESPPKGAICLLEGSSFVKAASSIFYQLIKSRLILSDDDSFFRISIICFLFFSPNHEYEGDDAHPANEHEQDNQQLTKCA